MTAQTRTMLFSAAVINAIKSVKPAFQGMVDESGRTVNIAVRSVDSAERASWPEVVIGVRPGRVVFGGAHNIVSYDAGTQQYICAVRALDSKLVFAIHTLNEAERTYFTDYLYSILLAGYEVVSGVNQEFALQNNLAENGILITGFDQPNFVETQIDDPKPQGQEFIAEVAMTCDLWLQWTMPALINPGGAGQSTATFPGAPSAPGQSFTW